MAKKGYPKIDLTIPDPAQAAGSTALSGRMPTATYAAFTGGYNGNPQTTMQQRGEALTAARYSNGASDSWTQWYEGFLNAQNAGNAIAGERYHPINPETPWTQGYTGGTPTNATGGNVELTPVQPTYGENINTSTGTNTSTGSSVSTGGTPTGEGGVSTVKPMTYTEWYEQQRQTAYDAAAQQRRNTMINNQAQYQQGLSTYGTRADSLGRMGLQGSGYADYLSGQAYVAKVNADSAAMATEALAQQRAEASYAQNLMQGRQQAEAQLLDAINMGATPSQVKQLADSLGVSDSAYVKMATDNYNNAVQGSISAEMTDEYISSLDYDETVKADITAKRDNATIKTIFTPDADFDTVSKAIADARSKGTLSEDGEKSAWYSAYIGMIDNLHFDNPNAWTVNDIYSVEKEIEAAFKSGKLTPGDRLSALEHLYQTAGFVATAHVEVGEDDHLYVDGQQHGQLGYVTNATNENEDMSRRLNYIATNNGDKAPEDGTVVVLGDDYYIRYNGGWRYVSAKIFRDVIAEERKETHQEKDHQK